MSSFAVSTPPRQSHTPSFLAMRPGAAPCGRRCTQQDQRQSVLRQRAWGMEQPPPPSLPAQTRPFSAEPVNEHVPGTHAGHDFGRVRVHAGRDRGAGAGVSSGQHRGAAALTRNPDDLGSGDEVLTSNGGNAVSAIASGVAGAIAGATAREAGVAPANDAGVTNPAVGGPVRVTWARPCAVAFGPSYKPTGTIRVIRTSGQKLAPFSMAAVFDRATCVSCCEVRQYIKWDAVFHNWRKGPPHHRFPSTADTWHEDRDINDKRFGHRSGVYSNPLPNCVDEYTTGGKRDQARGDTYCGNDTPRTDNLAMVGQFQYQLKVIDTSRGDAVRAVSSVITVNW